MVSRSIYNLKIDTIYMYDIPFDRSFLQLWNGIRYVMPSTDTKPELTAKASMAQPVSQPAVCANGLTNVNGHSSEATSYTAARCRISPTTPEIKRVFFFRPYSSVLLVLWPFCSVRIVFSAENGWFGEINIIIFWKETFMGHEGQTIPQQRRWVEASPLC
jgi:hypothetical protein